MPENAVPAPQSYVSWVISALGLPYLCLLLLAGTLCFLFALAVVVRGRGPMAASALVLIVPIPLLIGIFIAIQGAIAAYQVIAASPVAPKPSEVAAGNSAALVAPMVGMLMMIPSYLVAATGAFVRSMGQAILESEEIVERANRDGIQDA